MEGAGVGLLLFLLQGGIVPGITSGQDSNPEGGDEEGSLCKIIRGEGELVCAGPDGDEGFVEGVWITVRSGCQAESGSVPADRFH